MIKEKSNYIKKIADLDFKFRAFEKHTKEKQIYLFSINSRCYESFIFKRKMWLQWEKRFFKKFPAICFGVIEKTKRGLCHLHLWVVFEKAYSNSYIKTDIEKFGRKLWENIHLQVTKLKLIRKNQFKIEPLQSLEKSRNYLCKCARFKSKQSPFFTKPIQFYGSFAVSHGIKGLKLWNKSDLPSYRLSPKTLEKRIGISICSLKSKRLVAE